MEEAEARSELTRVRDELGDRYRVERLIGRGGMGSVYLARELSLDRPVALKVLPSDSIGSEVARERFRREARMAARLNHPSIVPLFSYGETDSLLYYVMGHVDGESLRTRIDRLGTLPREEIEDLLRSICGALDHAHRKGVIHRDIKPSNILIDGESGRILLTDFGISRAYGAISSESKDDSNDKSISLTRTGAVMGTPTYMAPEQASGSSVDSRCDIYSLGVTAYEAAAGEVPFSGPSAKVILAKKQTRRPTALKKVRPDLPKGLCQSIDTCLEPKPSHRPDTTERVLALMEGLDRRVSGHSPRLARRIAVPLSIVLLPVYYFLGFTALAFIADLEDRMVLPEPSYKIALGLYLSFPVLFGAAAWWWRELWWWLKNRGR